MRIKIAASILAADFSCLGDQVQQAVDAGVEHIHADVMDGHFVPNLSFGTQVVKAIKPITSAKATSINVHLMLERPEEFIFDFIRAGADAIAVHIEACNKIKETLQFIKDSGVQAGVTLNPDTPVEFLTESINNADYILVMSVNPGFGGQDYIPESTDRITRIRKMLIDRGRTAVDIFVDGGVNQNNAHEIVSAGASVLIAGSAIFNDKASIAENVLALRKAAAGKRN